jgi:NADH-quinone oxidoreductase subunit L
MPIEILNAPFPFTLAPLVILLPLMGLLINFVFGKAMGEKGIGITACLASGLAFVAASFLTFGLVQQPGVVRLHIADWISIGNFSANWSVRVDTLSVMMMLVVSGVGTLIHIYATGYMHVDVHYNADPSRYRRFFIYFNLFILMMMVLVSADNYLMLFVGWEGVGLCSYLLIGFWFEKGRDGIGNARAGKKAFIVNRVGDFGLLIALFLIFSHFGSFQFEDVFSAAASAAPGVMLAVTLFLLLSVAGKSAQIPLYIWLPDAMAGPTPVSALIHAATMVTAGVYLVARSAVFFTLAPLAGSVAVWMGALTAFFAATIAIGQFDIKRVLAYSTISQLGFMVAAVGLGAYSAGLFHLVTHAFFKALLFMAAGSVIQGMERGHGAGNPEHGHEDFDPQDMRNMGGLQGRMRTTFRVYLVGALTLAGIAPLAGFFSKDEILAAASKGNVAVFVILSAAALLTAFYTGRQLWMVFFGQARSQAAEHATESSHLITTPLLILAALSIVGGALNLPGLNTLGHWLERTIIYSFDVGFSVWVALLALGIALFGLILAWVLYGRRTLGKPENPDPLERPLGVIFTALQHKWWVDELYHSAIIRPYEYLSQNILADWLDQEVIDGFANDLGTFARFLAKSGRFLENGYVRTYALTILVGAVAILAYLVLR